LTSNYDICIIGAGIVGLATAYRLTERRPDLRIAVVEKEKEVAAHQTGHNSGVIHSGIYYRPGSLRAVNCRKGYRYLLDFCDRYEVPYEICGKVIVATSEADRPRLGKILETGLANGLSSLQRLSAGATREIEPHVAALESVWVPQAGIIDFGQVARRYARLIEERGGELLLGKPVIDIRHYETTAVVVTEHSEMESRLVINCAGLYSDKVMEMTHAGGPLGDLQILPFRGEYYELVPEKQHLVNNLIYPVPNPRFPFLGVHYTRMIHGGIEAGPNAVPAFAREGYNRWDVNWAELFEMLTFPGFQRLARKYWREGLDELYRSFSKPAFARALQHLIPEVEERDLRRGGAGVRAMAVDRQGNMIDDFVIREGGRVIHVANAPSPAATASLAIGEMVAERALRSLEV
jgi:L-2-hydroxyglutarate oxidase